MSTDAQRRTSSDGDSFGCVVWFALLIASSALLRYVSRELGAAIVAGIVLFASVALGGYVALKSASRMAVRGRVLSVVAGYVSILTLFAAAHYIVFRMNPNSFVLSADARSGRDLAEFSKAQSAVQSIDKRLYYLDVIRGDPQPVLVALHNESIQAIQGCCRVTFRRNPSDKLVLLTLTFSVADRETEFQTAVSLYNAIPGINMDADPEDTVIRQLLLSKTSVDLVRNAAAAAEHFAARRKQEMGALRRAAGEGDSLGFLDFLYFSTVTITTVGFGDIVPTSTSARFVVMMEAISGVAYIAFALAFLWPEYRRSDATGDALPTSGQNEQVQARTESSNEGAAV